MSGSYPHIIRRDQEPHPSSGGSAMPTWPLVEIWRYCLPDIKRNPSRFPGKRFANCVLKLAPKRAMAHRNLTVWCLLYRHHPPHHHKPRNRKTKRNPAIRSTELRSIGLQPMLLILPLDHPMTCPRGARSRCSPNVEERRESVWKMLIPYYPPNSLLYCMPGPWMTCYERSGIALRQWRKLSEGTRVCCRQAVPETRDSDQLRSCRQDTWNCWMPTIR